MLAFFDLSLNDEFLYETSDPLTPPPHYMLDATATHSSAA